MKAFKTVNDSYIEPISFVVPRRSEMFQSDIYPPATGIKPGMSAQEWLNGANNLPPKIDLESVFDGAAPVEVPSDYKPAASAPAPTPAKAPAPAKKEPEPERAPAAAMRAPPPSMSEQKGSIAAMASKYQDNEPEDDDNEDASSFEEIAKPVQRPAMKTEPVPAAKATPSAAKQYELATRSSQPSTQSTASKTSTFSNGSSSGNNASNAASNAGQSSVEQSLEQIKNILEVQTRTITQQSEKIGLLTQEVDTLKVKVAQQSGDSGMSERIRQLELELEAARS